MRDATKSSAKLARCFTGVAGIFGLAWACFSFPYFRAEAPLENTVREIFSDDRFSVRKSAEAELNADRFRTSALNKVAAVRLSILEQKTKLNREQVAASDIADLRTILISSLEGAPTTSFIWLAYYWSGKLGGDAPNSSDGFLRMSYRLGPNEGWVAVRRNRLALGSYSSLPDDLAENAVSEFIRLVRSGFYLDAANTLIASSGILREKLLSRLAAVPEATRRQFASVLDNKSSERIVVPGMDRTKPF
jgi:hypothetical protein